MTKNNNNTMLEISISNQAFENVFFDTFNDNGFIATGTPIAMFDDISEKANDYHLYNEAFNALPKNIQNLTKNSLNVILVKQSNLKSHVKSHIINVREIENIGWDLMLKTIEQKSEKLLDDDKYYIENEQFENELIEFTYNKLLNESKLKINDEKIVVIKSETLKRNFVDEYIEQNNCISKFE